MFDFFWVSLHWGKLEGKFMPTQMGPYPTLACAEQAAINFNKWYGASGASAEIMEE